MQLKLQSLVLVTIKQRDTLELLVTDPVDSKQARLVPCLGDQYVQKSCKENDIGKNQLH